MPVPLPLTEAGTSDQTLAGEASGALVRRSVLPGGVRVLTENMPHIRSATIGCWVSVGSRDEAPQHQGSTHFLEHLLFKGTPRRSALDIAVTLDGVGGEANAVTGKEHTCYYARLRDLDAPLGVDVLLDMVTSASLAAADVESERQVILEELAMNEDDPSDVAHEKFVEQLFGAHPLGRPIGGTPQTIAAVGQPEIRDHYRQHYDAGSLVITAAGGIDHDHLCDLVQRELARAGWSENASGAPRARRTVESSIPTANSESTAVTEQRINRQIEQTHIVLGTTGLTATDVRRHTLSVLNAVLGGGMSSRLFQEVREKRGLAYTVYSFASGYSDAGYFGMYAGCTAAKSQEVIGLLGAALDEIAANGITTEELQRAQGQISGSLVLGLEDSGSRMSRLGKAELVHGEYSSLEESLTLVRAVSTDDVAALAADLASRQRFLTVAGPQ